LGKVSRGLEDVNPRQATTSSKNLSTSSSTTHFAAPIISQKNVVSRGVGAGRKLLKIGNDEEGPEEADDWASSGE
jgi:hypothetical protein